jgi:toxin ParE1/3/4
MASFSPSGKAKLDLVKIAKYTQLTWGITQRNEYLKQLDTAFYHLAAVPKLAISCDDIRAGYQKYFQGSHVIYFKQDKINSILIVRILHKSMDVNRAF